MTATGLLAIARKEKPHVRYAANRKGTAVAAWHEGRWVMVAGLLLDGRWASLPYELLIDGKPCHSQADWVE